jgi:hypothetical protein
MYQVLGPKFIVTLAAWAAVSLLTLFGLIGIPTSLRVIVAIVDVAILTVLFSNPVWRWLWNRTGFLGRWLSKKVYPDLNGTYDVVLESNWPIVKRMLDASRKDAEPFDPFSRGQEAPDLLRVELEAVVEQTWFDITMWMYPKASGAVIKRSKTLATIPIRGGMTTEKELIYVFEQENDARAPTDDPYHEGAARLKLDRSDHKLLSGEYWNNRAWQRGVNVAGRLNLTRISQKPKRRGQN